MYIIGTDDGLYKIADGFLSRVCCEGLSVYDFTEYEGELFICSSDKGLLKVTGRGLEEVLGGSCWRLYRLDSDLVAFFEGPRVYLVREGSARLLADYTGYARELGWWFPHGPPHITDLAVFRGEYVASVEVGNMLVGPDLSSMKPHRFSHDQHNLLVVGETLLVATASGVYFTEDLVEFEFARGSRGYFHALDECGGVVVGHVMDRTPIRVSSNRGRSWERLPVELPSPTYGTTGAACIEGGRAVYSTTDVYEVDLRRGSAERLVEGIPMTRRVKVAP